MQHDEKESEDSDIVAITKFEFQAVPGIRDKGMSDRLQLDFILALEKAATVAR